MLPIHFHFQSEFSMDYEKAIDEVAATYANRGYSVVARPKPADLPDFAKDFRVQVVGRMRDNSVLVAIKRNRLEFAADPEMDRYAEVASAQKGWRFDFVLLEGDGQRREVEGAQEPSDDQIRERLTVAEQWESAGTLYPAFIMAWALVETAMRRVLRAEGEVAGWGTPPRQMIDELFSNGTISMDEHTQLNDMFRLRNKLVHGFSEGEFENGDVVFLLNLTKRLISQASAAKSASFN